jgi:diguanylate cyclase (GGDEF)-like protein/PAS domain S-box-containing protein
MEVAKEFYAWVRATRAALGLIIGSMLLGVGLLVLAWLMPSLLGFGTALLIALASIGLSILGSMAWYFKFSLGDERHRVKRLTAIQDQYGLAEDLAMLGSWIYSVKDDRFDWSKGCFDVFGVSKVEGVPSPKGFSVCIHPEDQSRWRDALSKSIEGAADMRLEFRYIRSGNTTIHVRCAARSEKNRHGEVVRIAGIMQDTTAVRAMANQLTRSEAKFRDLSQISSDWFWETDAEHKMSFISDSAISALGPWIRTALGKHRWDITERAFPGVDWQSHRVTLDARKPFNDFVYARIDPQGNLIFLSVGGRPQFDDQGVFTGYRGIGRNVTEEKERRMLLEIESNMAIEMREQTDPQQVVVLTIQRICNMMGWSGGAHLRLAGTNKALTVAESWGLAGFSEMIHSLPKSFAMDEGSIEYKSWATRKAVWVSDMSNHPDFAKRYSADELGLRAAFMAPIVNEDSRVMSALLMFGKISFRADRFIAQVAEILSRNLSLYLQRKAAERRLTRASLHDALTGLPNRMYLTHQLEARLKRGEPLALLYVDLDRFKMINDTLGHQTGDQVLIEVTRRTKEALRPQDIAGRIGGDEFIILLTQLDEPTEVEAIGRRLLAALEKPFVFGGKAYFLSGSIGVALAPRDGTDSKLLIKCADSAMYTVKSEGKNDVRFFSAELSDERTEQLQLAAELPAALKKGEVSLFYQPILNLEKRIVVGMEALIRWHHPIRGLLLPDSFLPIAEQSNLIREIGIWSIRRAIQDRITIGIDRFTDAPVSVNISAKQLSEDGFLGIIQSSLDEFKFPASLLRLELSESSFIQDPQRAQGLINSLRDLGVSVIIDNFGTGYASLSYIKNLPVDGVKIDQIFIRNMANDRGNTAIVQAVQTLAEQMGMKAMAEGVETAEELRALRQANCLVIQGEFISEPLPLQRLQGFIDSLPVMRELHQADSAKTN